MEKIALITDSACDLSNEIMNEFNIHSLPFRIIYKDNEYEDKVNITSDDVYSNLSNEIPTTSLPSIESIETLLCKLENEGYTHVISINISSNLSGTPNSVRLILNEHPKLISYIFDTKTLTLGEGVIVLEAAKMINSGKSFDEIISALPKMRKKSHVYFTLNTLEYLKKGGRIGRVSGTIGELFKLKPIIVVNDDGIYDTYAKARGRKQSINKLFEILEKYLEKSACNIWIVEGYAMEEATKIYNKLKYYSKIKNLNICSLTPALGVHTGPGLIGFAIQEV